jgi:nucleoside phosphorylase
LGAHVADPSQEADADLTVGGTIMFLKIDIYMKYWADLIVNVELKQRNKEATNLSLHTTGGRVAWTASSWEYYQPLRECQQKFSRVLIGDMEQLPNE